MAFLKWVDQRHFVSIRALVLYATLWMTYLVTQWAFGFAKSYAAGDGVGLAAVIGAVTAPVCALQAFVFKSYMDSKT